MTLAPSVPFQRFAALFHEEHRYVRDLLLELVDAFGARDLPRARPLLEETVGAAGPHFRYEEEALYPELVSIFGDEYVGKLLADHDFAIASSRRLGELARQEDLTTPRLPRASASCAGSCRT